LRASAAEVFIPLLKRILQRRSRDFAIIIVLISIAFENIHPVELGITIESATDCPKTLRNYYYSLTANSFISLKNQFCYLHFILVGRQHSTL
jgi:hypothetical protein